MLITEDIVLYCIVLYFFDHLPKRKTHQLHLVHFIGVIDTSLLGVLKITLAF